MVPCRPTKRAPVAVESEWSMTGQWLGQWGALLRVIQGYHGNGPNLWKHAMRASQRMQPIRHQPDRLLQRPSIQAEAACPRPQKRYKESSMYGYVCMYVRTVDVGVGVCLFSPPSVPFLVSVSMSLFFTFSCSSALVNCSGQKRRDCLACSP
ncbi:hypothetical protein QBC45DRAFT_113605 [Copromyces sp. CBS 386.78]|nr:hypothetical protein QBC45DRAFT_113605 [Copromyces sp. CBS 386.78]